MWQARQLIFHGGIILLAGLLCGAPFGSAIVRRQPEATIRAWRVAHGGIVMGGVMILVVGLVVPQLRLDAWAVTVLTWAFIVSGYGFVVALPLGAQFGHRGLTSESPLVNRIVYAGNMICGDRRPDRTRRRPHHPRVVTRGEPILLTAA